MLKDHRTITAWPDGRVCLNQTGNAGLAKAGSGDLLAGMLAGFMAQKIPPEQAAACAVYLHGAAADRTAVRRSQYGMLPSDILEDLCAIFAEHGR